MKVFMKIWLRFLSITYVVMLFSSISYATKVVKINNILAPDEIAFFDENGKKCFLDQFESKTILVVFWATWCSSCVKEMPDLDWLQKDFRKLPFEVVTVSQDFQGIDFIKKFFKTHELIHLKIYSDYQNQLFKAFSVIGLPTSFLINSQGKIVMSFAGATNWYDQGIRDLLLLHIPGNPEVPKNSYKVQDLDKAVKSDNLKNTKNSSNVIDGKITNIKSKNDQAQTDDNLKFPKQIKDDKIKIQTIKNQNDDKDE